MADQSKAAADAALVAPREPRGSVEDELCAAGMEAASATLIDGEPEVNFNLGIARKFIRRAFAGRTSGSCLLCGQDKPWVVMANGVGCCSDCRESAALVAGLRQALQSEKEKHKDSFFTQGTAKGAQ
jgi:hypothetical protein